MRPLSGFLRISEERSRQDRTGIPVLLLYGGKDLTVPPEKNCLLFIPRFQKAGGQIEVVARPEFGHHPHGLDAGKTQKIADFFSR
jgi:pimeloyl-ACP methyl ester carboxylesterase